MNSSRMWTIVKKSNNVAVWTNLLNDCKFEILTANPPKTTYQTQLINNS